MSKVEFLEEISRAQDFLWRTKEEPYRGLVHYDYYYGLLEEIYIKITPFVRKVTRRWLEESMSNFYSYLESEKRLDGKFQKERDYLMGEVLNILKYVKPIFDTNRKITEFITR